MKVITPVVNSIDFIKLQYYSLKKYLICEEGYEFIVFNDAKGFPDFTNGGDATVRSQISDFCRELGIQCIDIDNGHHADNIDATQRNTQSLNIMLEYQKQHPDRYLYLDSDMFLIDYLDMKKYDAHDCAIVLQQRNNGEITYFWPGLFYIDMNRVENIELMNWSYGPGGDTGFGMQPWLLLKTNHFPNTEDIRYARYTSEEFDKDGIHYIRNLWSCTWDESEYPERHRGNEKLLNFLKEDPRNQDGKFFCELFDEIFFHYRAACNWMYQGMDVHRRLSAQLTDIFLI